MHWETYLCTEKHICALKIYICVLENVPVMCSDQYLCTEIFICALHIWATVKTRLYLSVNVFSLKRLIGDTIIKYTYKKLNIYTKMIKIKKKLWESLCARISSARFWLLHYTDKIISPKHDDERRDFGFFIIQAELPRRVFASVYNKKKLSHI